MSEPRKHYAVTTKILDYLHAYCSDYKYVVDQFEFGHVTDPYDAVDVIDGLLLRIKDLADNDFVEERIEKLKNVYFQIGKMSDNIVWNYEVHRYYHPDTILTFLEEMNDIILETYERK